MRRTSLGLIAVVALLMTAACGGDDESTDGSAGGATGDSGELTPVTVGVIPIVDTAAIWLGVEQGIFEEHGLDVQLEVAQGGAAIVPGVISDEFQFGFSNVTSLLLASHEGLPLQIVAPGNSSTGEVGADIGAVVTMPGTGIESAADLNGRTVAVNTLNNIGDSTIRNVVELDGGDPSDINFVEMPFPDMPAAVVNGQVDAAWILEPFLTITMDQGATPVSWNFVETDPDLMIAAYFTSKPYAQENPEVVEAFSAAMAESLAYAEENPDEARAILSTYTELDPAVQEAIVMPRFEPEVDTDSVELLAELAQKYGMVDELIDTSALLP
ncbi:MAG TPA: ABC transporter substrate-binding protein [Jiangellaceae bacterium]|nr:ABC transporter substrate-binding protein [Jiangellaceae bacterium]